MTEQATLPEGTVVRALRTSVSRDTEANDAAAREGQEYRVCYYVAGKDLEDGDPDGRPFYAVDQRGSYGGSHWAFPEDLEVVRTAAELAARDIPSLRAASEAVASGLHGLFGSDGVEVHSTSIEGPDDAPYVSASGRTDEGYHFGMKIAVLEVWSEDSGDDW